MDISLEQFTGVVQDVVRSEIDGLLTKVAFRDQVNEIQSSIDGLVVMVKDMRQELTVHRAYDHAELHRRIERLERHTGLNTA